MSPNVVYQWTAERELAAQLCAEGIATEAEIAKKVGIDKRQVQRWKKDPAFAERVRATVAALVEASRQRTIGRREDRVEALQRRWLLLQQVMDERAADPRMQDIPGGKTGLIVIKESEGVAVKDPANPDGPERAVAVPTEVAVDTGFLKELREHEKQAAQELGQWTEKRELTGANGGTIPITIIEFVRPKEGDGKRPD